MLIFTTGPIIYNNNNNNTTNDNNNNSSNYNNNSNPFISGEINMYRGGGLHKIQYIVQMLYTSNSGQLNIIKNMIYEKNVS